MGAVDMTPDDFVFSEVNVAIPFSLEVTETCPDSKPLHSPLTVAPETTWPFSSKIKILA